MSANPLLGLVESHFSDTFLFDPSHKHWRDILTQNEGWVDLAAMSSFVDLANACGFDVVGRIGPLIASSEVLESRTVDDRVQVRRKVAIDANANPDARTIFTKPIHTDATNEQIKQFFEKWGKVASVERRYFAHLDLETKAVTQKARPSCFVVFETAEGANACLAAKPSYGTLPDALGSLFVPRLTVATKDGYEQRMSDVAEKDHQQIQRKNLMGVADAATKGGPPEAPRPKMMQVGACVKAIGLAEGTTWMDVKCRLGNLAINDPQLKNSIVQCKEAKNGTECYLVMRSPDAANLLITTYTVAISAAKGTDGFLKKMRELREKVPGLVKVTGEEEARIMQEYPTWTGGQPIKKRVRQ
jgi:hypothetical protein